MIASRLRFTSPESGSNWPAMILRKVDFPEPFRPTMPMRSRSSMVSEALSSTTSSLCRTSRSVAVKRAAIVPLRMGMRPRNAKGERGFLPGDLATCGEAGPGRRSREMKTVLITGANRGIGLETARQLAGRGFHVVMGARNEKDAKAKAEKISNAGGKVSVLRIDVSDSQSVAEAAKRFGEIEDHLDVLINNAGIYPDKGVDIVTIRREQLVTTFQTNTFGPIEVTQRFLPYLRKAEAARVINVSSGYGQLDGLSASVPSYCLSKLTLNGVTIMFAQALKS